MAPVEDDSGAVLGPPQFHLRTLMFVMSAASILFACMAALGALWSLVLALFTLLVTAHVAGNAVGTRLCDGACGRRPVADSAGEVCRSASVALVPARRLQERTGLSRTDVVVAAVGALLGGASGGIALASGDWEHMGVAGLGLGTLSSAVLGAFCGFLASSFFTVSRRALAEALTEPKS